MKLGALKELIAVLPDEMDVVCFDSRETSDVPAQFNIEERTLALHPVRGLEVSSPSDYQRYLEGKGTFFKYAEAEGLTNIRLERCLVMSP